MKIQKYIIVLFIFLFPIIFSCTKQDGSAPETVKIETDKTKIVELSELSQTVENLVAESKDLPRGETNTNTANSIDPYWLGLDYKVPAWGGITDVTELPEYIYAKVFWDTKKDGWPTTEELFEKYELEYDIINAANLNSAGFELYEKEEYLDAIALFREAIWLDPTYAYAHYNLACTGALLLKKILETDLLEETLKTNPVDQFSNDNIIYHRYSYLKYYPFSILNEIFNHLATSFFLNSDYIKKSQVDNDLKIIHSMKRFRNFMSFSKNHRFWSYYGFFKRDDYREFFEGEIIHFMVLLDGRIIHSYKFNNDYAELFGRFNPLGDEQLLSNTSIVLADNYNSMEIGWKELLITEIGYLPRDFKYGGGGSFHISSIDNTVSMSNLYVSGHKEIYDSLTIEIKEYSLLKSDDKKNLILSSGILIERIKSISFLNKLQK